MQTAITTPPSPPSPESAAVSDGAGAIKVGQGELKSVAGRILLQVNQHTLLIKPAPPGSGSDLRALVKGPATVSLEPLPQGKLQLQITQAHHKVQLGVEQRQLNQLLLGQAEGLSLANVSPQQPVLRALTSLFADLPRQGIAQIGTGLKLQVYAPNGAPAGKAPQAPLWQRTLSPSLVEQLVLRAGQSSQPSPAPRPPGPPPPAGQAAADGPLPEMKSLQALMTAGGEAQGTTGLARLLQLLRVIPGAAQPAANNSLPATNPQTPMATGSDAQGSAGLVKLLQLLRVIPAQQPGELHQALAGWHRALPGPKQLTTADTLSTLLKEQLHFAARPNPNQGGWLPALVQLLLKVQQGPQREPGPTTAGEDADTPAPALVQQAGRSLLNQVGEQHRQCRSEPLQLHTLVPMTDEQGQVCGSCQLSIEQHTGHCAQEKATRQWALQLHFSLDPLGELAIAATLDDTLQLSMEGVAEHEATARLFSRRSDQLRQQLSQAGIQCGQWQFRQGKANKANATRADQQVDIQV